MTGRDVTPRLKDQGECGCGCGRFGTFKVKAWSDDTRCTRNCDASKCRHCRGLRSKRRGQRSQAKAAKALGVPVSPLRPGHEELTAGALRFEDKSGRYASPVITKFRASQAQSEVHRPIGDHRPFVATFSFDGLQVFVIDANDALDFATALLENWQAAG